jgi:alkanesulfonate monooxygenase SsuD/methylene tetrahydromethanopterin reductase-like flavin-dependent oxidoreductase (luciferase family)
MSNHNRQLKLNAYLNGTGHHEASWRLPETSPERNLSYDHVLRIVQTAERGLLDSVLLTDGYSDLSNALEPFTWLAALASRT